MMACVPYIVAMLMIISLIFFTTWGAFANKDFKTLIITCLCFVLLIAFGVNCYEHKININNNVVCECIFCEKENASTKPTTNQIIVQNNENVNIYVDDKSKITIIEDNKWTCCDEEIKNNFCPECGNQRKKK
jgi:hypothetical protein